MISSAGPRSAFLAHTHTIAQILGLLDALAGIFARLEAIEDLLPTPNLLTRRESAVSQDIEIPDFIDVFPSARLPADFDPQSLSEGKAGKLPRPPGLLPAIHDATVVPIAVPLPRPEPSAGNVFQNTTNVPPLVSGGLGRRGGYLEPLGFAGSDVRVWYRRAQFLVVIEAGTAPGQGTPSPVSENPADVVWQPAHELLLVVGRVAHALADDQAALHFHGRGGGGE